MKAARYYDRNDIRIEDLPEPELTPGAVAIDVAWCGICGTIGYANDHPSTIKLVQEGKIDLAPFITAKIPLDDLISGGFDQLINNNEQHVKILVNPKVWSTDRP